MYCYVILRYIIIFNLTIINRLYYCILYSLLQVSAVSVLITLVNIFYYCLVTDKNAIFVSNNALTR